MINLLNNRSSAVSEHSVFVHFFFLFGVLNLNLAEHLPKVNTMLSCCKL